MEYINSFLEWEYFYHSAGLLALFIFGTFFIGEPKPKKVKRKQVKGVWYCKKCHHELTKIEREYKGGVCPYCDGRTKGRVIESYMI